MASAVGSLKVLLSADTARFGRDMRRVVQTSEKSAQRIQRVMRVAAVAISSLAAGVSARAFIQAASAAEQYGVRLEVMLRSQSEANRLFRDMAEFAGKVPFEFEAIMGAATQLSGVLRGGVDEIKEVMPIIGDLAATTGLSIQQTTEQIVRMFSAGAGAADLFRERGVLAMLGFTSGVSYSAEDTRRMVIESWTKMDSQFRGATGKLANTWAGLTSMMSDRWFQFRVLIMDRGVFDSMKDGVRSALAVIDRNMQGLVDSLFAGLERVRVFGAGWVEVLSQMNTNTQGLLGEIAQRFAWLSESIGRHFLDKLIEGFTHLPTNLRAAVEIMIGMVDRFRIRAVAVVQVLALAVIDQWQSIQHNAELLWLNTRRIFAAGVDAVLGVIRDMAVKIGAIASGMGRTGIADQMFGIANAIGAVGDAEAGVVAAIETATRERTAQNAIILESIALIEAERNLKIASSHEATALALAERDAILARMQARIDEARALRDAVGGPSGVPLQAVADGVANLESQVENSMERISTFGDQAARNVQTAFADFLFDPFADGLKGMLKGFIDVVRRMIAEAAALKLLGGDGMGDFFSAILTGLGLPTVDGRAAGGPVSGGTPYIVGEKGPELFMPNTSGSIVPNHKMGGGVVVNVTVPANVDPRQFVELAREIGRNVMEATETRMNYGYWPA